MKFTRSQQFVINSLSWQECAMVSDLMAYAKLDGVDAVSEGSARRALKQLVASGMLFETYNMDCDLGREVLAYGFNDGEGHGLSTDDRAYPFHSPSALTPEPTPEPTPDALIPSSGCIALACSVGVVRVHAEGDASPVGAALDAVILGFIGDDDPVGYLDSMDDASDLLGTMYGADVVWPYGTTVDAALRSAHRVRESLTAAFTYWGFSPLAEENAEANAEADHEATAAIARQAPTAAHEAGVFSYIIKADVDGEAVFESPRSSEEWALNEGLLHAQRLTRRGIMRPAFVFTTDGTYKSCQHIVV